MNATITQCFAAACERPPEAIALRFKRHKSWIELNWRQYFRQAEAAAHGLNDLGIQAGDRVAILANTRWEWATLDFAILGLSAVTVPIYHSSRTEEVEFILNNADCKALVIEGMEQWRKWEVIAKRCPSIQSVITLFAADEEWSDLPNTRTVVTWEQVCESGAKRAELTPRDFIDKCNAVEASHTASIVYTSGTTGEPKGVVITHNQIMAEVTAIAKAYPVSSQDSTLSFLPYAHVLGRVELWLHTYLGFTLNFAESVERIKKNLLEVRPTVIIGVPRIFEKIYAGVNLETQHHPWMQQLLRSLPAGVTSRLLDRFFFTRVRDLLGGKLRFAVSGGAPLEPKIAEFFRRAGILVLEGYGLTETTAAIAVNTPDAFLFGSVGRPLSGVDIQLADDGEILVRGGMVMQKYYNNPEATHMAMEDGYLKTGDIGEWTPDGFLRITDRKKDLIKTAGGKYVAPQKLAGLLTLDPLISHALIHGDQRKYIVALITLNEDVARSRARNHGWRFRDYPSLTQSTEAYEAVRKIVTRVNSQLASHETIKTFAILPHDFTVEKGELTPSLKIKRRVRDEHYRATLDALYA